MNYINDKKRRILGEKLYADRSYDFDNLAYEEFETYNTTSTSPEDIPGYSLTIVAEKAITVLVLLSASITNSINNSASLRVELDGTDLTPILTSTTDAQENILFGHYIEDLSVGSHTFKLQLNTNNAGDTAYSDGLNFTVIRLTE